MPPQLILTFVLAVALPLAWLASEFQPRRWLRILLGTLALSLTLFLVITFSILERLNYNAWYGHATAEFIDTTIQEIEGGRTEQLLPALRKLREDFNPTYETRDHYDQRVTQFVKQVREGNPQSNR